MVDINKHGCFILAWELWACYNALFRKKLQSPPLSVLSFCSCDKVITNRKCLGFLYKDRLLPKDHALID